MVSAVNLRLNAADRSYFAILKKEVHALSAQGGFSAKRIAEIDIVVAELVSNLARHAGGGEIFAKLFEDNGRQGLELIAIDSGPGIGDLRGMMQDGASTKDSLGQGLGAIRRLSDLLQIYTQKDWGTLQLVRVYNRAATAAQKPGPVEVRSLVVPKPGETECGDGFYFKQTPEHLKLFLGDGLGHGPEAAHAVRTAIDAFKACPEDSAVENLRFINSAVKKTRGLVATVAIFHMEQKQWRICGVGNIATRLHSSMASRNHNPYNGIVGLNMPNTMNDQVLEYEKGQTIVMCSDGFKSKWDLLRLTGIQRYDLSLLNAALFKEFARQTDDMSVASCKINV
ncbi:SpoIIE family protein phosphatase [Flaviaesturariibacter amylovorans]|uniref:Serine/threonine protein kinase n=1 Tax=Flaviaesturariibacter amylovorans TaxID=1084520 RepID=A0ABP8HNB5_9BACT